jgi:hypothetical protein
MTSHFFFGPLSRIGERSVQHLEDLAMLRSSVVLLMGVAVCSAGLLLAADQKNQEIQGGIDGKIKSVDVAAKTLTIVTQGRERTFTVTEDTVMLGPRGGKVRRHLKDPRFREGFPVTVVAQGTTASEVHLGFARDADNAQAEQSKTTTAQPRVITRPKRPVQVEPSNPQATEQSSRTAKYPPQEDEDTEIPGKIKSFDPSRRILVVSLLNGKDRSFILSKNVAVMVKGTASKHGLQDPAMRAGAKITVTTDEEGRRVKEIEIVPATRLRKAG